MKGYLYKKSNRSNATIYIFLIFVAICFLATGGIFVKLSSLPPINTGFLPCTFFYPYATPFYKKEDIQLDKKRMLNYSFSRSVSSRRFSTMEYFLLLYKCSKRKSTC